MLWYVDSFVLTYIMSIVLGFFKYGIKTMKSIFEHYTRISVHCNFLWHYLKMLGMYLDDLIIAHKIVPYVKYTKEIVIVKGKQKVHVNDPFYNM